MLQHLLCYSHFLFNMIHGCMHTNRIEPSMAAHCSHSQLVWLFRINITTACSKSYMIPRNVLVCAFTKHCTPNGTQNERNIKREMYPREQYSIVNLTGIKKNWHEKWKWQTIFTWEFSEAISTSHRNSFKVSKSSAQTFILFWIFNFCHLSYATQSIFYMSFFCLCIFMFILYYFSVIINRQNIVSILTKFRLFF